MPPVTGMGLAVGAFRELNVFLPGEPPGPADGATALEILNDLLSELDQRASFTPIIARTPQLPMVAGKGGPTNPYTIGLTGDIPIPKPSNQNSIVAANLILTSSVPNVRVPLAPYTDASYDSNAIPDLPNTQPTGFYYNPTYQNDLGTLNFWPVPTISTNTFELFIQQGVAQFADLSTLYFVPDGWPAWLKYGLAERLSGPYGKQLTQTQQRLVMRTEGVVKRATQGKLTDVLNDAQQFAENRATYYNVLTGSGGA
jgi:hypothetical protein